jgi:hypothetical protein
MLQPHKYRHSNPVHRNAFISALTLLPGPKPAAHSGQEPPEEPKQADPTLSNRRSSWPCPKEILQATHTANKDRSSRSRPHQTRHAGKNNTLRPKQPKGSAHINPPTLFARGMLIGPECRLGRWRNSVQNLLRGYGVSFRGCKMWLRSAAASIHSWLSRSTRSALWRSGFHGGGVL